MPSTLSLRAFLLGRANWTRAVSSPAARVLFYSGVCDLHPIRTALAVVARVVRPLSVKPDNPDDYCCEADVDRNFLNSPERLIPAALNSRM